MIKDKLYMIGGVEASVELESSFLRCGRGECLPLRVQQCAPAVGWIVATSLSGVEPGEHGRLVTLEMEQNNGPAQFGRELAKGVAIGAAGEGGIDNDALSRSQLRPGQLQQAGVGGVIVLRSVKPSGELFVDCCCRSQAGKFLADDIGAQLHAAAGGGKGARQGAFADPHAAAGQKERGGSKVTEGEGEIAPGIRSCR